MPSSREILWRLGVDSSDFKSALQDLAGLLSGVQDDQEKDREKERRALEDYSDSIKQIASQLSTISDQTNKQLQSAQGIANSYRELLAHVQARLDQETKIADQMDRQKQSTAGGPRPAKTAGPVQGGSSASNASVPEWMAATAKLRADIAQEVVGTGQVATERQRIINLIDLELAGLKVKDALTKGELADLKRATLERERQTDAIQTGGKIGVTQGTREALRGVGGAAMQGFGQVASAAVGGESGAVISGLMGGLAGGGIVAGIQLATDALSKFVSEIRNLVNESDRMANIESSFKNLASAIGAVPTSLLNQFKESTDGLVGSTTLMSQANSVLLQGLPFTGKEINNLVGSVTTLARLQGKDVTESFADVTRALSSGRLSMLAYRVGLDETAQIELRRAQTLPEEIRRQTEYNIIMEASARQTAKMGDVQETLGTKLTKASTAWEDFEADLATAISKSEGAKALGDAIIDMVTRITSSDGIPRAVQSFNELISSIQKVYSWKDKLLGPHEDTQDLMKEGRVGIHGLIDQSQPGQLPLASATRSRQTRLTPMMSASQGPQQQVRYFDEEKKLVEESAQIQIQAIQRVYNARKMALDMASAVEKQAYSQGKITLQDYVDFQKQQVDQEYQNTVERITKENQAKQAGYRKDIEAAAAPQAVGGLGLTGSALAKATEVTRKQEQVSNAQADTQRQQAAIKRNEDLQKVDQSFAADKFAATQTELQKQFDISKSFRDQDRASLEENFKEGLVSAQDYLNQRMAFIQQEYEASIKLNQDEHVAKAQGFQSDAELAAKDSKAFIESQKERQNLTLNSYDIQEKAAEEYYSKVRSMLRAQLAVAGASTQGTGIYTGDQTAIIQATISEIKQQVSEEEKLIALLDQTNELWIEGQQKIASNREELIKLNAELIKSRDLLTPLGGALSRFGTALGVASGPGTKYITGAAQGLSQVGGMLSTLGGVQTSTETRAAADTAASGPKAFAEAITNIAVPSIQSLAAAIAGFISALPGGGGGSGQEGVGGFALPAAGVIGQMIPGAAGGGGGGSSVGGPLGTIITDVKRAFAPFSDTTVTAAKRISSFSDALENSIGSIAGFVKVMSGQQGTLGGAISGASQGQGLGSGVGGMFGKLAGSIGGAIGGFVGAIIGVFSAKALAKTQAIAQKIQDSFNNVIQSLNVGTTNLSSAIQQAQALQQQAIAQLSGQKGGQNELNQMLPQFEQTINQLQAQQAKLLATFDQTTQILDAPQPFQQYLSQFQQIIAQYQQYIDAGGNVAEANDNLAQSFNNLRISSSQQLLQNEQDAISNAINYNDLLVQQQQLVMNTNQQIENVMAQGSVTRQAPTAMTKGLQIAEIQTQYQLQAQNLNEQINVAQYRYQIEQKIYGLASTRVGLEMELAQVQEGQVNQTVLQETALQSVMAMLNNSSGAIAGVSNAVSSSTNSAAQLVGAMNAILSALGINVGTAYGQQVQQLLEQILAGIPGLNPPMTVNNLFGQPVQGNVPIPSFDEGGLVQQDQLAMVHAGETVVPVKGGSNFASAMAPSLSAWAATAASVLANETQILNVAQQRLQIELQIYQLRAQELGLMGGAGPGSTSSTLLKAFLTRGQQGIGGFSGGS